MATFKKVLILTGSSRGLGAALLDEYQNNGYFVYHCSRSLPQEDSTEGSKHFQISLNDFDAIEKFLDDVFGAEQTQAAERLVLINNAGRLGQSRALKDIDPNDLDNTIGLNLTAAMLLTSKFLKAFESSKKEISIINISSGAANSTIHGWSAYSASKAGMNAMTKTVALELSQREAESRIISIYPGIIDTAMQAEIRATDSKDFPSVQRFVDFKENEELVTAEGVAAKIFYLDEVLKPESGSIIDVRTIKSN